MPISPTDLFESWRGICRPPLNQPVDPDRAGIRERERERRKRKNEMRPEKKEYITMTITEYPFAHIRIVETPEKIVTVIPNQMVRRIIPDRKGKEERKKEKEIERSFGDDAI
jgi:hypothetical protein